MKYFLSVLAMVLIIEGMPYFLFPAKVKVFIKKIEEMEDPHLRGVGLMIMIVGLILLYISKIGIR